MEKQHFISQHIPEVGLVKTTKIDVNNHEVFLDEEIGPSSNYRELISLLFNASENDSFIFYINTPGGDLFTTRAIIEGMKATQANVTGILMGETHSGGSMIAMYCHGLAVLDSAEMMIHTAQFGSIGFSGNVKSHTDFAVKQVERLINEAYEGFLTETEIIDVKKGVELWFGSDEIKKRIERRVELLKSKEPKEEQDE